MSERVRVPVKASPVVVAEGDVAAAVGPAARDARRFSISVAEEALQRMAPVAIEYITRELASQIRHEQYGAVADAVGSFLHDRAWAEPIIREAIRDAVRGYVRDILADSQLERRES